MIAAPLVPPVVVIPQAVDRLVVGPVVVAQEWMAARQDPDGGMEKTVVVIRPGVDRVMVRSAAVPETHQDLLADAIVVMGTGALKAAVRMIAALKIAVMGTGALKTGVLTIGVSIQSALKTAARVTAA